MEAERRDDWRLGWLGTWIYNSHPQIGKKKRRSVKPGDLIASLRRRINTKQQSQDEIWTRANRLLSMLKAAGEGKRNA